VGAHPSAYVRLREHLERIRIARYEYVPGTREYTVLTTAMDKYLDEWYGYRHMATEWDAGLWGFDVDTWMHKERRIMENSKRMRKAFDGRWYEVHRS
jgi:hypothetical protein